MKTKKHLHTDFIKFLTLENYISHHFQGKEKGIEISKGVSRKYQMVDLLEKTVKLTTSIQF